MIATRLTGHPAGPGRFAVPSATVPGRTYVVVWMGVDLADCACPGFTYRGQCKHVRAVETLLETERRAVLWRRELGRLRLEEIEKEFAS